MLDLIIIPSAILGVLTTLFTELLKRLPFWANTPSGKKYLAVGVAVVFTTAFTFYKGYFTGSDWVAMLVIVITSSYGVYRQLVEPIAEKIDPL